MIIWKPDQIVWNEDSCFNMPLSDPLVMASAAGWYVGEVCKDPNCGGMIVPFDRMSEYYATPEEADALLREMNGA